METVHRFKRRSLRLIVILLSIVVLILAFSYFRSTAYQGVSPSLAASLLKERRITSVSYDDENFYMSTDKNERLRVPIFAIDKELLQGYTLNAHVSYLPLLPAFLMLVVLSILSYILLKKKRKTLRASHIDRAKAALNIGDQRVQPNLCEVSFDDVAGIDVAKEELKEIVDFLKYPRKYKKRGIRLPKGVLLAGPPGVGKTLIAKAVAGEAGVPFFYHSGATFASLYVGAGPKRIKELFAKAKKVAPAIVFIDEIDAVGKKRGEHRNDEREATLNQLLTEMDGFEDSSGIIVIGATNKIEVLDDALLRAGRFDRRIHLALPDQKERKAILDLYTKHRPVDVNTQNLAQKSSGFSGAMLENWVNEALLLSLKEGVERADEAIFDRVLEKVLMGSRKQKPLSAEQKEHLAYLKATKAVLLVWQELPFHATSLLMQDRYFEPYSKKELYGLIRTLLAPAVILQKSFATQTIDSANDLKYAKSLAKAAIYEWMSEGVSADEKIFVKLLERLQKESQKLSESLDRAIEEVAKVLLEKESIDRQSIEKIIKEHV